MHGTYRHLSGDGTSPAALLISESGATDRNGDNNVAGPIGNMRQLAEFLSDHGVATLRYDKVGTGPPGWARTPTVPVMSAPPSTPPGRKRPSASSPHSPAPMPAASRCTRWGRAPCTP